jgi:hypothetical protein
MFAPSSETINLASEDMLREKASNPEKLEREVIECTLALASVAGDISEDYATGYFVGLKVASFIIKSGGAL